MSAATGLAMAPTLMLALLVGGASLLSVWMLARTLGARHWRVWAPLPLAVSFWLALFPPSLPWTHARVVVLTPGASPAQLAEWRPGQRVFALPGLRPPFGAEPAPDLGSVLRRMPETTEIEVVGAGLPARDLDALSNALDGRRLRFDAAPERGIVALDAPGRAVLGVLWRVQGRLAQPNGRVELRDPSGAVVDGALADASGRFQLGAPLRAAGPQAFEVRALDADGAPTDRASLPVLAHPGESLSLLVRAGAVSPELKYWRRWASDAGFQVGASAVLSDGITLGPSAAPLSADALAQTDVLSVDDRAWTALAPEEKSAVLAAVDEGLGLLLRASGPLHATVAQDWANLGFVTQAAAPRSVTLDAALASQGRHSFRRVGGTLSEKDLEPLLRADDGTLLAAWRARGQGRVAYWGLEDSYRLVLLGERARYATLWARTLARLSRAHPPQAPEPEPAISWVDQRLTLCGLQPGARVQEGGSASVALLVDESGCAAYWPRRPGWQQLRSQGAVRPIYTRGQGDGQGLVFAQDRAATQALAAPDAAPQGPGRPLPLPRWPFLLTWLLLAAMVWWGERGIAARSS